MEPSERVAEVRAALRAIVSDPELGPGVLSDRVVMAGVIKDYLPDAPRETGILLAAVEHGVPRTLRERVLEGMDASTAIRLTASWFSDVTLYTPDACDWAVGEIALALGLSTPVAPGPQPQPQPTADVTAGPGPQPPPPPPPPRQPAAGVTADATAGPGLPGQDQPATVTAGPRRPGRGRLTLVLVVAGVVVLAGAGVSVALLLRSKPTPLPTPVVKIAVSSPLVVGGDVVVSYRDGKYASATVSGNMSRTRAGEVAKLVAVPFPFKTSQAVFAGSRRISASSQRVTFSVTPSLETQYFIGVYASSSAEKALNLSAIKNVYVTTAPMVNFGYAAQSGCTTFGCAHSTACSRPECYVNYLVRVYVPASAIRLESGKHLNLYFAINLSPSGNPATPKTLYLATRVSVTQTKLIGPDEYEQTIPTRFYVGNKGYNFKYTVCTRDTLSVDGLGLPGHHGCGDATVQLSQTYLG
jgi:hypothetical protein